MGAYVTNGRVRVVNGKVVVRPTINYREVSRSKYRNQRIDTPDGKFDSKAEYARWCELKLEQRAGGIANLRRQVKYELIPSSCGGRLRPIYYIADFVYERDGKEVVEDHKGAPTANHRLYLLKKRLMLHIHNITVVES